LGRSRVLGPEAPLVDRIRGQFLKDIVIKLERENVNLKTVKELLREQMLAVSLLKPFRQVTLVADVDPV
jgi:primosomal protein N' (replication factor Y)